MATITYIGELAETGSTTPTVVTSTRTFLFASEDATFWDILRQEELPNDAQAHPVILNARCIRRTPTAMEDEKGTVWKVACEYSTQQSDSGYSTGDTDKDPWDLPPYNISYDTFLVEEGLFYAYKAGDANYVPSVPIVNKAGQLFSSRPTTIYSMPLMRFSYNIQLSAAKSLVTYIQKYYGSVNKDPRTILGVSCSTNEAKMHSFTGNFVPIYEDDDPEQLSRKSYYQINVEILLDPKYKHQLVLYSNGYMGIDADDGNKKKTIYYNNTTGKYTFNPSDSVLDSPAFLDANGKPISTLIPIETAFKHEFRVLHQENWGPLSLPVMAPHDYI